MFTKTHFSIFALAVHLSSTLADEGLCDAVVRTVQGFRSFNASNVVQMPALRIDGITETAFPGPVVEDQDDEWYMITNVNKGPFDNAAMRLTWLNTGNTNNTGMGSCSESLYPENLGVYSYPKEVLERSVNDKGDCKTMFGEKCVAALQQVYHRRAVEQMLSGRCTILNNTVPFECRDLTNGHDTWLSPMMGTGINLTYSYELDAIPKCNDSRLNGVEGLNSSIHGLGGVGGLYNASIRFPTAYFLTFWPNRTGANSIPSSWDEDVQVEIRCTRPDDIQEGSTVPPSAEEILEDENIKFAPKLTEGSGSGPSSTGAAWPVRTLAPYLGAAGLAAALLV